MVGTGWQTGGTCGGRVKGGVPRAASVSGCGRREDGWGKCVRARLGWARRRASTGVADGAIGPRPGRRRRIERAGLQLGGKRLMGAADRGPQKEGCGRRTRAPPPVGRGTEAFGRAGSVWAPFIFAVAASPPVYVPPISLILTRRRSSCRRLSFGSYKPALVHFFEQAHPVIPPAHPRRSLLPYTTAMYFAKTLVVLSVALSAMASPHMARGVNHRALAHRNPAPVAEPEPVVVAPVRKRANSSRCKTRASSSAAATSSSVAPSTSSSATPSSTSAVHSSSSIAIPQNVESSAVASTEAPATTTQQATTTTKAATSTKHSTTAQATTSASSSSSSDDPLGILTGTHTGDGTLIYIKRQGGPVSHMFF